MVTYDAPAIAVQNSCYVVSESAVASVNDTLAGNSRSVFALWMEIQVDLWMYFKTTNNRKRLHYRDVASFWMPSRFRAGVVHMVVTRAMMTIMVNSVGENTPTL
jgi:hypothetical protein